MGTLEFFLHRTAWISYILRITNVNFAGQFGILSTQNCLYFIYLANYIHVNCAYFADSMGLKEKFKCRSKNQMYIIACCCESVPALTESIKHRYIALKRTIVLKNSLWAQKSAYFPSKKSLSKYLLRGCPLCVLYPNTITSY